MVDLTIAGHTWSPPATPPPELIRAARDAAGLTQAEAAALVWGTRDCWQKCEAGVRNMRPIVFAAFALRTGQVSLSELALADRHAEE